MVAHRPTNPEIVSSNPASGKTKQQDSTSFNGTTNRRPDYNICNLHKTQHCRSNKTIIKVTDWPNINDTDPDPVSGMGTGTGPARLQVREQVQASMLVSFVTEK